MAGGSAWPAESAREGLAQVVAQSVDLEQCGQQVRLGQAGPEEPVGQPATKPRLPPVAISTEGYLGSPYVATYQRALLAVAPTTVASSRPATAGSAQPGSRLLCSTRILATNAP
jgi:hypothetical protein